MPLRAISKLYFAASTALHSILFCVRRNESHTGLLTAKIRIGDSPIASLLCPRVSAWRREDRQRFSCRQPAVERSVCASARSSASVSPSAVRSRLIARPYTRISDPHIFRLRTSLRLVSRETVLSHREGRILLPTISTASCGSPCAARRSPDFRSGTASKKVEFTPVATIGGRPTAMAYRPDAYR